MQIKFSSYYFRFFQPKNNSLAREQKQYQSISMARQNLLERILEATQMLNVCFKRNNS